MTVQQSMRGRASIPLDVVCAKCVMEHMRASQNTIVVWVLPGSALQEPFWSPVAAELEP